MAKIEQAFEPKLQIAYWGLRFSVIGEKIKVTPSVYNPQTNMFDPTGETPYKANVIAEGQTYGTVCLSRSARNCARCDYPPNFCTVPIRKK